MKMSPRYLNPKHTSLYKIVQYAAKYLLPPNTQFCLDVIVAYILEHKCLSHLLPSNTQFCLDVMVAYILEHKCLSRVHEDGILKWMGMDGNETLILRILDLGGLGRRPGLLTQQLIICLEWRKRQIRPFPSH